MTEDHNIIVSKEAIQKIHGLVQDEPKNTSLQIYVKGGGCHGFQYGLQLQNKQPTGSHRFEFKDQQNHSISIIIDAISFQYLQGVSLDYKSDAMGEQFIIKNPNAKTTCGCGNSFSTD